MKRGYKLDTIEGVCTQVEIKTTKEQRDTGLLQKAADLVNAFILGVHPAPLVHSWAADFN
jgi:rRNA processing protein Krr1/Pno1